MSWIVPFVIATSKFLILYFLVINTIYLCLLIIGGFTVFGFFKRRPFAGYDVIESSQFTQPVSIIVPAYNEATGIVDSVRSLLELDYPEYELIVVNDGSTDDTLSQLRQAFGLRRVDRVYRRALRTKRLLGFYASPAYPTLTVVDKEQGGKSDALNVGVNIAHYPLVCTIDADTVLERRSLVRIVKPILEDPLRTIAVGGIVRVANGCRITRGVVEQIRAPRDVISGIQVVEYLKGFLVGRPALSALNALLIVSGAFGLFRKQSVIDVGGFSDSTITEDLEMIVRLHRYHREHDRPYRIVFIPDPVAWTEVPRSIIGLVRQRIRWHIGMAQTFSTHREMFFRARYGAGVGLFAVPHFVIFESLGSIIEVVGYVTLALGLALSIVNAEIFWYFMLASVVYGMFISVGAVLLEEFSYNRYETWGDFALLVLYALIENLGIRQILSFARAYAIVAWLTGRTHWRMTDRHGIGDLRTGAPLETHRPYGSIALTGGDDAGDTGMGEGRDRRGAVGNHGA